MESERDALSEKAIIILLYHGKCLITGNSWKKTHIQYFILEKEIQLDKNKCEWNFENLNYVVTIDIDATIP